MGQDQDSDREHRYNNYVSRYYLRHIDLMDLLADVPVARHRAARCDGCASAAFPASLAWTDRQVYGAYLDGAATRSHRYCETWMR